jgi:arginine:agmatine antiporter
MIGSGVFLLPASLAAIGSITLIGWLIAAIGALLIAQMLGRLAFVAPDANGPCGYARETLGPYMGFQSSVIYWISCWLGNIAIAIAAIGYLSVFVPALAQPIPAAIATIALIWAVTGLNIFGPRIVCQIETVTLISGLIPILIVSLGAWWIFNPDLFEASWNVTQAPALDLVPQSLVLVFWAFVGLESAAVSSSIVEQPERNVSRATLFGVILAAIVYISACNALFGLIPADALARSNSPFADAVGLILGQGAVHLVAGLAFFKAAGTLAGWILVTGQVGKAAADSGAFPAIMGRVNEAGVPVINLLVMAALMAVIVIATISPSLSSQFAKLIDVSVVLVLMIYIYSAIAVFRYRDARLNSLKVTALAAGLVCIVVIAMSDTTLLIISGLILVATLPAYYLRRHTIHQFSQAAGE